MDIDRQQQVRYDRQIRLWGDEGQLFIQQARICVFGSSALAAEILKSLVLAGIGAFHIIDDSVVHPSDLGQNFFLEESAVGKYRGECLVKLLSELNPSVHGQHSPVPFKKFTQHDLETLVNFSLVIGTNMTANEAVQLDQFLYESNIPFVFARVYGMLGHLRLSFRHHVILNNHNENDPYDLRLDCPFPELSQLINETDLSKMTHEQHSHTPYILLYFKAIEIWKQRQHLNHNVEEQMDSEHLFPDIFDYKTRKEIEKILMEMRQPDDKGSLDEENFEEAKRNFLKAMGGTKVPENVSKLLDDPRNLSFHERKNLISENNRSNVPSEIADRFWLLFAALREFIKLDGCMPLSGQLPDMTSDSKRYAQLVNIYRKKAMNDAVQLHTLAKETARRRIRSQSSCDRDQPDMTDAATTYETDESTTDTEDDLSRMSTTEANEQFDALGVEGMEGTDYYYRSGESNQLSEDNSDTNIAAVDDEPISIEECQKFCKNASKIGIQYGLSLTSEYTSNLAPILRLIDPPELSGIPQQVHPLSWYILLRAVDRFHASNDRFPLEQSDLRDLKRCLSEFFAESKDIDIIGRRDELFPAEMLEEMVRFGASEPHVIATIVGGCVAQEAIKICTRQYIPVDNSLIFDGHSQQATTFRVNKE